MRTFKVGFNDVASQTIASLASPTILSHSHKVELARGKVDPATQIAERVAAYIFPYSEPPAVDNAPVVVSSRHGNAEMVERFSIARDNGHPSPISYSASGYNIIAQSAARGFNTSGSSLVLAGNSASLCRAVMLIAVRMRSTGAQRGLAMSSHSWPTEAGYANVAIAVALDHTGANEVFDAGFLRNETPRYTDQEALEADLTYALSVSFGRCDR